MTYIEQLVARNFKRGESLEVDALELQRLANYAIRKEIECEALKVKISFYELDEYKKPEKIKLYA